MLKKKVLKRYVRQIIAIVEKNFFLELRYKSYLITRFINPLIQLVVFIFIFGFIFNIRESNSIGYWNTKNYTLFLLVAFAIQFSRTVTQRYANLFMNEKFWKTLSATMVAPVNHFVLLFGILFSELLLISVPIIIIFIIALILFPISIFYIILMLVVFLSIYLILSSIGLLISAFSISNEKFVPYLLIMLRMVFLFSCTV